MKWGLLGPEMLGSQRRVRTLGLASVVRLFNDLAAPGMGGVWFGKQLLIAALGVALAVPVVALAGTGASNDGSLVVHNGSAPLGTPPTPVLVLSITGSVIGNVDHGKIIIESSMRRGSGRCSSNITVRSHGSPLFHWPNERT